jgi:hypothetical protein
MGSGPAAVERDEHGDVFARDMGAMIVHVQRESGLAHRTFVLSEWHVKALRVARHRGVRIVIGVILLSWGYLAIEAARVPLLMTRIARMEQDALRLDTLQQALTELHARYEQVQAMLSRPAVAGLRASDSGSIAAPRAGARQPE